MSFTRTLMAGAAVCALCTAPALARVAPGVHLAASGFDSPAKLMHTKTNVANPNISSVTSTYSFSVPSLSESMYYKVPVQFNEYTWYNPTSCLAPANEGMKIAKTHPKDKTAKIAVGSSTGGISACPSTTYTFYGPLYELKSKTATSDAFKAALVAKKYSGYNFTLNENWAITITP